MGGAFRNEFAPDGVSCGSSVASTNVDSTPDPPKTGEIMRRSVFRYGICLALFIGSFLNAAFAQEQSKKKSLGDEVVDLMEQRITREGPDYEVAMFISHQRDYFWPRREKFFELSRGHLEGKEPEKVAGAISVLEVFRNYQPGSWIGGPSFEEVHAEFFNKIDDVVIKNFAHFKSLKNDEVYKRLATYLGCSRTYNGHKHPRASEAHDQLRQIIILANNKEQALICLTWHRDPADMEFLMPYMLEDTDASRSLPYCFRNSYGKAAKPFLERALDEAKSEKTRDEAKKELDRLNKESEPSSKK